LLFGTSWGIRNGCCMNPLAGNARNIRRCGIVRARAH